MPEVPPMIAMTRGGPVGRLAMVVWIVEWGGIASENTRKWNSWALEMKNLAELQGDNIYIYIYTQTLLDIPHPVLRSRLMSSF